MEAHYLVHKSLMLYMLTPHFINIHFSIILLSARKSLKQSLPFSFLTEVL
jgi:hypothetical protein